MRLPQKLCIFLLAAAMVLSAFSGCGGSADSQSSQAGDAQSSSGSPAASQAETPAAEPEGNFNPIGMPIVKEQVTKNFMLRKPAHIADPNDMVTFQKYEEMTNVKVNWDVVAGDGFNERVNLVMASNTMPDAIIKGTPDITKTSADGSIIDLTELIDKYSTGIKALYEQYPAAREAAYSPDGKIYSMPTINTLDPNRTGHRNLWINQKWLDQLGLKTPTTMEEYLDVLRAFRDKDANGNGDASDEIPYVLEFSGDRTVRTDVFLGSWGITTNMGYYDKNSGTNWMTVRDDKTEIIATQEYYKEVLQLLNLMWNEKLLDNTIYTQTSDVALSKFNSEISGSFGLSSDDLWSEYSDDYVPLAPPKVGDYQPVIGLSPVYGGHAFVITRADKTPEISLRWIDYFYTDEGSRFIGGVSEKLEGITCQKLSDGNYEYSDEILTSSKGVSMAVGAMCPLPGGGFPYWRNENNSNFIYSQKVRESAPIYKPYYQKTPAYALPVFSVEDSERVTDIRRDLDIYMGECQAKFITGELSFDKWEEYVQTCEKMNIRELESIFQAAYDRMK